MDPFGCGKSGVAPDVRTGKVAIHFHVRRTEELHHHLALSRLVAPSEDGRVRLLGPKPGCRGVWAGVGGVGSDVLAAGNALAGSEISTLSDHAESRRGAGILRLEHAGFIHHRIVHVPDAEEAVGLVEDRCPARFVGRIGAAPVHLQFLVCVALDDGQPDPDAGRSGRRVPVVDLVGERIASRGGKPEVLAAGFRLAEIEPFLVQPHQYWEVLLHGQGRQVRAVRRGQDCDGSFVLPTRILHRDAT